MFTNLMIFKYHYMVLFTFLITGQGILCAGNISTKVYDLDSTPKDLIWCGPSRDTVIVLTEQSSLYKSDDRGFSWKKLNDILTNTGKNELEENENEVKF